MPSYQFELDRRSVFWTVGGLLASLFLTFVAGVVVGLRLQLPDKIATDRRAEVHRAVPRAQSPAASSDGPVKTGAATTARDSNRTIAAAGDEPATEVGLASGGEGPSGTGDSPGASAEPAYGGGMQTAAADPMPTPDAAISAPFTIQVGFFSERSNAEARARRVRQHGESAVIESEQRNGRTFYKVWAGEYGGFGDAARDLSTYRRIVSGAFVARTD